MTVSPIKQLFTLQRSPIALAPVVHKFFHSSSPRDRDLLLSYLVLPMVLHPLMQKYLLTVRKTSNLRTLCQEQSRLVGLVNNTHLLKKLTNSALLVLTAEKGIQVSQSLSIKSIASVKDGNANPDHLEAARRLAIVFAEVDVVSIYRTLGFKSL